MTNYHSHGKLLLTAEYLVLRGAKALALPTIFGQSLNVVQEESSGYSYLNWFAHAPDKPWFRTSFELPSLDIIATDDRSKSATLQLILLTLQQLKPDLLDGRISYRVVTRMDFEPEWGLGSSSSLIANLAKWSGVNPYTLLNFSIGGSGYDLACANAKAPIFYEFNHLKPLVKDSNFAPPFADKLFFVYSGRKQDSAQSVRNFNEMTEDSELSETISEVSAISEAAAQCTDFDEFCKLMDTHEQIVSALLLQPTIKTEYTDFNGSLKSLGAWGGDFLLAMSKEGEAAVREYFQSKGKTVLFPYNEMVKQA